MTSMRNSAVRSSPGMFANAALQLLSFAYRRGAGVVDDDLAVCAGAGDNRMRVRAATGLHLANLHGPRQVADVENSNPTEALGANVLTDAFEPAVNATRASVPPT